MVRDNIKELLTYSLRPDNIYVSSTLIRLLCNAGYGPSKGFAYGITEKSFLDEIETRGTTESDGFVTIFTSLTIISDIEREMLFPELKEWDMGKALDNIAWNPTVVVYDKSDLKAVSRQDGWKDCFRVRYNGTGNLADAVVAIVQEGEDPRYNAFVEELREKFQRGCRGEDVFFGYEDVPDVQCKNLCMNISAYLNGALTQARETPGFPDVEEIVVGVSLRRTNATLIDHNPQFGPYNLYRELVTERAVRRFHQALVLRD